MKKGLIMLSMVVGMIACDDGDDVSPNTQARIESAKAIVQEGQWRITYFKDDDDGDDDTYKFIDYTFDFASNGVLTATKGEVDIIGKWSIKDDDDDSDDDDDDDDDDGDDDDDDDRDDDDDNDDVDFNIYFSSPSSFNELSEDWDIVSITSTKIVLEDDDEFLTFERD
jgi:hypothetical protein